MHTVTVTVGHRERRTSREPSVTRPGRPGRFGFPALRRRPEAPVGRLFFTANALPAVRLMNVARTDGLIVIRIAADSTVARKLDGVMVTFEADELDARTRSGWLVMLTGRVTLSTDPAEAGTGRCRWSPGKGPGRASGAPNQKNGAKQAGSLVQE
jgi:hypothetical protein